MKNTFALRNSVLMVLVAFVTSACGGGEDCPACGSPRSEGQVESPDLVELSGVTASARFDNVLYAHNDSSDSSRLFAMSAVGEQLAVYNVEDAANDDWEDIAYGPCAVGQCLYVGDIGDNDEERATYDIYLAEEPEAVEAGTMGSLPSSRVSFTYPDGSHNAEVLLVHPTTGVVTIVLKAESGPASVYEVGPLVPDQTLEARLVGEVDPPEGKAKFTGGSIHPDGTGILLRTNSRLFHYPMSEGETAAEALSAEGCPLPVASEAQGEAVSWLRAGDGFVTIGEGLGAPVNVSDCDGG